MINIMIVDTAGAVQPFPQEELDFDFIENTTLEAVGLITSRLAEADIGRRPDHVMAVLTALTSTVGSALFDTREEVHEFNEQMLDAISFTMDEVEDGKFGTGDDDYLS